MYFEMQHEVRRLRRIIMYTVDDLYRSQPGGWLRAIKLYTALWYRADRQTITVVKFEGVDSRLYTWTPHLALQNLSRHGVNPSIVILYDAFTPHPATHDVDALATATDDLIRCVVARQLAIREMKICNVPQNLVFLLACRILNQGYSVNMNIQQMTNILSAEFQASNNTFNNITVPVPGVNGAAATTVSISLVHERNGCKGKGLMDEQVLAASWQRIK